MSIEQVVPFLVAAVHEVLPGDRLHPLPVLQLELGPQLIRLVPLNSQLVCQNTQRALKKVKRLF